MKFDEVGLLQVHSLPYLDVSFAFLLVFMSCICEPPRPLGLLFKDGRPAWL